MNLRYLNHINTLSLCSDSSHVPSRVEDEWQDLRRGRDVAPAAAPPESSLNPNQSGGTSRGTFGTELAREEVEELLLEEVEEVARDGRVLGGGQGEERRRKHGPGS